MFKYKLVRKIDIHKLQNTIAELKGHMFMNGGFVDETGTLKNSQGKNDTVLKHWEKFYELVHELDDRFEDL